MNLYQNLFDQYQQGTLPRSVWEKHIQELKATVNSPGFQRFRSNDTYFKELWEHIDAEPTVPGHAASFRLN